MSTATRSDLKRTAPYIDSLPIDAIDMHLSRAHAVAELLYELVAHDEGPGFEELNVNTMRGVLESIMRDIECSQELLDKVPDCGHRPQPTTPCSGEASA